MLRWDPTVVARLLKGQFPGLSTEGIEMIGRGFDNELYLIGSEFVFKMPTRKIADQLIVGEGLLLPVIRGYISIDIPEPVFFGRPTGDYPYHFLGYRHLDGFGIGGDRSGGQSGGG